MLNRMVAILCTLFVALSPTLAWAQSTIKGSVVDEQNAPIVGATVVVVGTNNGAATSLDGSFTLSKVKAGSQLQVSFLGYETQTIEVTTATEYNIVLKDASEKIEDVVVVGYGTQKKASVTAAISQISGSELAKAPVGNVTNMLAGRVAGLTAVQSSGQPGADSSSILVRGQSVLYIVDGVPREINQINPEDIESISVLKDASAAAVYGLDGNTDIIVTTKRGTKG